MIRQPGATQGPFFTEERTPVIMGELMGRLRATTIVDPGGAEAPYNSLVG